jgi:hypothetical protein
MSEVVDDSHEDDAGLTCANGDGAPASVERDGRWICTDCDVKESGTTDLND